MSVGKAELLSAHFDGKRSMNPVDQPSTCHPSPSLTTFAFRLWEEKRILLDPDFYGGTDPSGIFPVFSKRTADVLAPRFAVEFLWLLHVSSFLVCWRVTDQFI